MKKTVFHQKHIDLGAKMGEFAGYDMPLFYGKGVLAEHLHVREKAGLFDVSHMGIVSFKGEGALDFIEKLTPSFYAKLGEWRCKYSVLTNEQGGIIDDLIFTNMGESGYLAVINAGCKDKDIAWFKQHLPSNLEMRAHDDRALLALQGSQAETVLSNILNFPLSDMAYMSAKAHTDANFGALLISRLGYTGEDGFEISVPNDKAIALWDALIADDTVEPIGLAARDSLRLEMGYPLYGHDLDDTTSPIEAGLSWVVSKNNDTAFGIKRIQDEKLNGVKRHRVGMKLLDKGIAREGTDIFSMAGEKIGIMTSGGHSPILKEAIGMGYVEAAFSAVDTEIIAQVRGRDLKAVVVPLPFIDAKTKKT
jgi:aminomethyltransferase